jgi:hypothetical protein
MIVNNLQSLQSVRVMLDAKVPRVSVIVVTSASEEDGQMQLACDLAHSFGLAGRRTALISMYQDGQIRSENAPCAEFVQAHAALSELEPLLARVRAEYDAVIVASPPVGENAGSLDMCRISDGVLLAVRLGRKIAADDEQTVKLLQSVSARILGIVATRPSAKPLEERVARPAAEPALERTPVRVPTLLLAAALLIGGSLGLGWGSSHAKSVQSAFIGVNQHALAAINGAGKKR